jgi:peptidoglycan/LPS O-acetylase OafA/YrhL
MGPDATGGHRPMRYIPALDGLRGLGVFGILLFHAGYLTGGWLGVDLFFVLSGFLITTLLLIEYDTTSGIRISGFWSRRARRLLPALFTTLLGVALYAALLAEPAEVARIRSDALATLAYVANWQAIHAGHDYWALFRTPSPLNHTWSLAIEEQFYLFWPLLALLTLRAARGSERAVFGLALGLGLASAAWMAWRFDPDEGTARVYFGTDTRAAATLVGAALAVVLSGAVRTPPAPGTRTRLTEFVPLVAAAVLAWAWCSMDGSEPGLYRGGLLVLSLAAGCVIAGVVLVPDGLAARILALKPLCLLGVVSYGVYLWHWPLYIVLSPARLGFDGLALAAVRVTASLLVGVVSYRVVERPIRRAPLSARRTGLLASAGAVVVALCVLAATHVPVEALAQQRSSSAVGDGAAASPTDVLLIGDSAAWMIGPALAAEARSRGLHVETRAAVGCTLLRSDSLRLSGRVFDLAGCSKLHEDWQRTTARLRPRMVLIFDGWPGAGERKVVGTWRHPCDPAFDSAYAADLTEHLHGFSALGATVAIIAVPPPLTADLKTDVSRDERTELGVLFEQRLACLNGVRSKVARETGARILDLAGWLCPDGTCRREDEGSVLRPDGVHFEREGAHVAARWLLTELEPLLRPSRARP